MTLALALTLGLGAAATGVDMPATTPGQLEGRPAAADASPLQAEVDRAPDGATIDVPAGEYRGDLLVDHPVRLVGHGRPRLVGSGSGSVVRVRAPDVVIEGFDIDGRGGGDLGRDSAGIHVSTARVTVRDCRIDNTLFGIYLRAADGARLARNVIHGIKWKASGEKGSGIHVWNTTGFLLVDNELVDVRDGFYIQSSSHGYVRGNRAHDLRYGLHYMYSDDNVFEDNLFENTAAATVLMYSQHITFRRNRFLHNRGYASVGILFKACDDSLAEDNLVADNARGIFLEGSYRDTFRRNVVADSDTAIMLYDSCGDVRFENNSFVANLTSLTLVGRRTDTRFDGNYWSDNDEPDLDGDGISDRPYVLGNLFDHFRGNLTAADLLAQSLAAAALARAERSFPVLEPIRAVDHAPLTHAPALPAVPRADPPRRGSHRAALASAFAALFLGLVVVAGGRRRGAA